MASKEAYEYILQALSRVPDQLQMMVDSVVGIQKEWPMPEEGWEQFQKDLEYTNKKHDLNLVIKEELLK